MSTGDMLLAVEGVSKRFGGLTALDNVSFNVARGEIHALIGPNGAGKTTMLNLLTRIYRATSGQITMEGRTLGEARQHEIARRGIGRTFQHVELFPRLTVLDNVAVGAVAHSRLDVVASLLGLRSAADARKRADEKAMRLLDDIGLAHLATKQARELTGGQARLVGLARALATEPKLLLLDELVAGLNSRETEEVAQIVRGLRDRHGITVLAVEHDMRFVMGISDRITVLNFGCRIASGTREEVRNDQAVIDAYLGTGRYSDAQG
jgi:ABC-type branched-subunit amino acid transport system ATPase component